MEMFNTTTQIFMAAVREFSVALCLTHRDKMRKRVQGGENDYNKVKVQKKHWKSLGEGSFTMVYGMCSSILNIIMYTVLYLCRFPIFFSLQIEFLMVMIYLVAARPGSRPLSFYKDFL